MIGLGRWKLDVAIPFVKVSPVLIIGHENGNYTFTADMGGFGATPAVNLLDVKEEGNNTLRIKLSIPMLSAGEVSAVLTFDGIHCTGMLEVPMIGKITVKGIKAED